MPADEPPTTSTRVFSLLRCHACGRTDACTLTDRLRYTREGWPRCCGDVMSYFAEVEPPKGDDTALDRPALPPSAE